MRKLGVSAINGRLFSKEHIARTGQALTDPQVETSIALSVYAHQRAKTKWDQFPSNDLAGCVTDLEPWEFSTKPCPGEPFRSTYGGIIRQGVKQGLKVLQTGLTGLVDPVPDVPPPDPKVLPFGLESEAVAFLFGTLNRVMPDGTIRGYPADPTGVITNSWLGRATAEGDFPRALEWKTIGPKNIVQFANGWVLYTPAVNDHINWRWIDQVESDALGIAA